MTRYSPEQKQTDIAAVSVVIACYRCADTIERAVQSVLAQTIRPAQIILVDDGSDDETADILRQLVDAHPDCMQAIFLDHNRGVSSARNAGWDAAAQPYVAFLDADDAWHPRKIEIQYGYMQAHSGVALSGHRHRVLDTEGIPDWEVDTPPVTVIHKLRMLMSNQFVTPSVMLRRDLGFRFLEGRRYMEDHLLWMEAICDNHVAVRLEVDLAAIFKRSFGEGGLSANLIQMERSELGNYLELHRRHALPYVAMVLLLGFSLLKFIRRVLIVQFLSLFGLLYSRHSYTLPVVLDPKQCLQLPNRRVLIVMATYRGGRYIEEQIRSIQAQTFKDWVMYIRDDGSPDDTVQKIQQFEAEDSRIRQVLNNPGNRGAIGNFSALMETALDQCADYVFFADQDDVWEPEKLAILLGAMVEMESQWGRDIPLLAHSDLAVVDRDMKLIAPSFTKYVRLAPKEGGVGVLLCQNQVTGCACVINHALLKMAYPVPSGVLMHDWWLALLAAAAGKVGYVPRSLVRYRQHGGNVVGAEPYYKRLRNLAFSVKRWKVHMKVIRQGVVQARLLAERIASRQVKVHRNVYEQVATYGYILDVFPLFRWRKLREHRIYKQSRSSGFVFRLIVTLLRKEG